MSVAAPIAAAGLACALALLYARQPAPAVAPRYIELCERAAYLLYDISWAAACRATADDSNDCTLPEDQARRVNGILASEESRCMADARGWADR